MFINEDLRLDLNCPTVLHIKESNGAQAHSHMCIVKRNGCRKTGKREFCLTAHLMGEVMQLNTEDWQMSRDVNTQRHLKSASPTDSRARSCCSHFLLSSLISDSQRHFSVRSAVCVSLVISSYQSF